jgi:hypothetical protein
MDSQAVVQPSSINTFRPKVLNFNLPKGADHRSAVFPLVSKENNALRLAESARFDEMCAKILWGSEDPEVFGEFLRSLVVNFQPENVFELTLLRNVAACQWKLIRLESIQHNLFVAGKEVAGPFGLPAGTSDAMAFEGASSELLADLQRAIRIYRSARAK